MSRQRPMKVFELGITHLILLGLFLNAVDGVLCKGKYQRSLNVNHTSVHKLFQSRFPISYLKLMKYSLG
jgi:hypothetical protein